MTVAHGPADDQLWSVQELTRRLSDVLRTNFPNVWVTGEISNLTRAGSGHCYLTLKDDAAQIRAVIWRSVAESIPFAFDDGLSVVARGSVEVYAGRGQYQLMIRELSPRGIGPWELAFRQLCEKLDKEGLFDPRLKRPIPTFPRKVAVVTSSQGAAVRDFLEVARRRWRGSSIIVFPTLVQGPGAVEGILAALDAARQIPGVEVVALIRGGGSLEDLAAFNSEPVARSIRAIGPPVVTGVGHEIDVTVADLVADVRALTPSEAAERIFPDQQDVSTRLLQWSHRAIASIRTTLDRQKLRLDRASESSVFRRPIEITAERSRRLDEFELDLTREFVRRLAERKERLIQRAQTLEALSPWGILGRGYALATDADGAVVRNIDQVEPGQPLFVRVADGKLECRVVHKEKLDERP